jgi:predicted dehydrogenase
MTDEVGLRAAVLGYGFAGRIFHAPFLRAAGFEVAAICTSDPHRHAQAVADFPQADVVAAAGELIGREDLDLIVVATPNASHAELAIAALEHGHDVVVDKPFAPTVADAKQIVATADDTGGVLSVFQSRRFDSDFRTAARVLDSGELGTVHRFESRYERWRPALADNWRESADPAAAGGLLFDLGAHLIDQFLVLFGTPSTVYAELGRRRQGSAVPDDVFLALQTETVTGHLWMSALAADAGPRFRILGDRAGFVKYGMDPQEAALLDGRRPPAADWGVEAAEDVGRIGAADQWHTVESARGDYTDFYSRLAVAIAGEGPVPVDPADAVTGLQIIQAAQRSAAMGTVERLR